MLQKNLIYFHIFLKSPPRLVSRRDRALLNLSTPEGLEKDEKHSIFFFFLLYLNTNELYASLRLG